MVHGLVQGLHDDALMQQFVGVSDDQLTMRYIQQQNRVRVMMSDMNMEFQEMARRLAELRAEQNMAAFAAAEKAAAEKAASEAAAASTISGMSAAQLQKVPVTPVDSDDMSALEEDDASSFEDGGVPDVPFETIQETLATTPETLGLLSSGERAEQARLMNSICRPSSWY